MKEPGRVGLAMIVALAVGIPTVSPPGPYAGAPGELPACDSATADPWVQEFGERIRAHSHLARHAAKRFGAPGSCRGAVVDEFDGMKFGALELGYTGEVVLRVETFPPEASRETLTLPAGFDAPSAARELLQGYLTHIGVGVDWDRPSESTEGERRIERYESDEAGMNVSVEFVFEGGRVTAVRFQMAL